MTVQEPCAICDQCNEVVPDIEATFCDGCGKTMCADCRAKHECGAEEGNGV